MKKNNNNVEKTVAQPVGPVLTLAIRNEHATVDADEQQGRTTDTTGADGSDDRLPLMDPAVYRAQSATLVCVVSLFRALACVSTEPPGRRRQKAASLRELPPSSGARFHRLRRSPRADDFDCFLFGRLLFSRARHYRERARSLFHAIHFNQAASLFEFAAKRAKPRAIKTRRTCRADNRPSSLIDAHISTRRVLRPAGSSFFECSLIYDRAYAVQIRRRAIGFSFHTSVAVLFFSFFFHSFRQHLINRMND